MNKSLQNGVYPSKLKHAKIIQIYKSDGELDPSNNLLTYITTFRF